MRDTLPASSRGGHALTGDRGGTSGRRPRHEARENTMNVGRLAARVVIGGLFIGHGTQKLFGWFGGPGLAGTEEMMSAINMRPTRPNALAAGVSETAGGAMLVAGLATPLASASLIGTMVTAVRAVHLHN